MKTVASGDRLTTDFSKVFNPASASPEQQECLKHCDFSTDIFGVGTVLLFSITGAGFEPDQARRWASGLCDHKKRWPDGTDKLFAANCPSWVGMIVQKMLEPDKEKRFASVKAIATQVRYFLEREDGGVETDPGM